MFTKIAKAAPFEGAPCINTPLLYGASPMKPFLYRIPVSGERPIKITVSDLPEGLSADSNGIISGAVQKEGVFPIVITAENSNGRSSKELTVEIAENNILATPLLGFTSWNAFRCFVTQDDIIHTAYMMEQLGITEYGYNYVNIDSSWQGEYGGKYDAIQPNEKFPDIKRMVDLLHAKGLHCGIYSSPMMLSWGNFADNPRRNYPGCTKGPRDIRFADTMGGIGINRFEANNVRQWDEWGIDYLKYDWGPTDTVNADIMRKALDTSSRDIGFCVTVWADFPFRDYWKKYTNSWRCEADADCNWEIFLKVIKDSDRWLSCIGKNHFYDLDMLEVGWYDGSPCQLSEDEQITAYSIRIIFNSPIQFSCILDKSDDFLISLLCNSEVIAVNQDIAFPAQLAAETKTDSRFLKIYKKQLSDGNIVFAYFNFGDTTERIDNCTGNFRDIWAHEDIYLTEIILEPHCCRMLKTITHDNR